MTYLGRGPGSVSVSGTMKALLGAVLTIGACTGEHRGSREEELVPAMTCTFAPQMIAELPEARFVDAMGLEGANVYFRLRDGGVWRLPKMGGPLTPVASPPLALTPRALPGEISDDSYVYRLDQSELEIVRLKKDGSTRTVLADVEAASDSFTMVIYGPWLYWTSSTGGLHKVPKAGGAPSARLASFGAYDDDDYRGQLAVDPDGAFYLAGPPGLRSRDADPLWLVRACR